MEEDEEEAVGMVVADEGAGADMTAPTCATIPCG
jgi:hypothetical protein